MGSNRGFHTLLAPRSDDCIAILLGSPEAYRQEFFDTPPTYYLSVGWLEAGTTPLEEYESYVQRYGEQKAVYLMNVQYRHYRRLAFVAHSQNDLDKYRSKAQDVAAYCAQWGMIYEEILGSEDFIRGLLETAQNLESLNSQFILVPPGGELLQQEYLRM